jgi:hypothetical protein
MVVGFEVQVALELYELIRLPLWAKQMPYGLLTYNG